MRDNKNMKFDNFIYEERMTTIRQESQMDNNSLQNYISTCKDEKIPDLMQRGARINCILQGIIGTPTNVFLQITKYPSINSYYKIQTELNKNKLDLIENEQVRFLMAITNRPKDPFPIEDHRPIYSNRVFYIDKKDIEKCADLSYNKVWPLYEAWGCSVLGLFSSLSFERFHAIKLFAGYKSITHWEKTRNIIGSKPDNIEENVWEEGKKAVFQRAAFTLKSRVTLMRAIYLPNEE